MRQEYLHSHLTERIIKGAYAVFSTLGTGFLEKVYENALVMELAHDGLSVKQQMPLSVRYRGEVVGDYFADLLVNETVVVELKAVETLQSVHEVQLVNAIRG